MEEPHPARDAGAHVDGGASHSHPHNLESWEEKERRQDGANTSSPRSEGRGQLSGPSGRGNVLDWGEDMGANTSLWTRNHLLSSGTGLGADKDGSEASQLHLKGKGRKETQKMREQRAGPRPGLFITLLWARASSGKGT